MGKVVGLEGETQGADERPSASPLQNAVEGFGRRGRGLVSARLEALPGILIALKGVRILQDADARRSLAIEVERVLRAAITGFNDPTDRRIAQVVLASEPEFYDQTIEVRKQIVLGGDMAFSANQFATRRPRIIVELVSALQDHFSNNASSGQPPLSGDTLAFVTRLARSTRALGTIIYAYDVAALNMHRAGGRPELYTRLAKRLATRNRISDEAMYEYAWSQHLLRVAALDAGLTKWMVNHGLQGYLGGYLDSPEGPDAFRGRELIHEYGSLEPSAFVDVWLASNNEHLAARRADRSLEWREDRAETFMLKLADELPDASLTKQRVFIPNENTTLEFAGYHRRVLMEGIGYLWGVLSAHIPNDPLEARDIRERAQQMASWLTEDGEPGGWHEPETKGFTRPVLNQEARQMFSDQFFGERAVWLMTYRTDDPEMDSLI